MKTQRAILLFLVFLMTAGSLVAANIPVRKAKLQPRRPRLTIVNHTISDVVVSPSRPASLSLGEQVKVTFKYVATTKPGVRIFMHPMTGARPSANYAVSGSPLYPTGSGTGNAHFTITGGDVTVDNLRFDMKRDDNQQVLVSHVAPVRLRFSEDPLRQAEAAPKGKRTIRPDGKLEIARPDGTTVLVDLDGTREIQFPDGRRIRTMKSQLEDGIAGPPARVDAADAAWIEGLNKWLDTIGAGMLRSIEHLAGNPASFQDYKEYEDGHCQNLYQRVDTRERFLDMLIANEQ